MIQIVLGVFKQQKNLPEIAKVTQSKHGILPYLLTKIEFRPEFKAVNVTVSLGVPLECLIGNGVRY